MQRVGLLQLLGCTSVVVLLVVVSVAQVDATETPLDVDRLAAVAAEQLSDLGADESRPPAEGSYVWAEQFATDQSEVPVGLVEDSAHSLIVAGRGPGKFIPGSTVERGYQMFLRKVRPDGDTAWTVQLGHPEGEFGPEKLAGIVVSNDDSIYLAGLSCCRLPQSDWDLPNHSDGFVARYSPAGERLWLNEFDVDKKERVHSIVAAPDGGVILQGWSATEYWKTEGQTYLAKFSPDGIQEWMVPQERTIQNLVSTDSGNLYGWYAASDTLWLAKYDGSGERLWEKPLPWPFDPITRNFEDLYMGYSWITVAAWPGDGVVVAGAIWEQEYPYDNSVEVLRYDSNGNLLWVSDPLGAPRPSLPYPHHRDSHWIFHTRDGVGDWHDPMELAVSDTGHVFVAGATEGVLSCANAGMPVPDRNEDGYREDSDHPFWMDAYVIELDSGGNQVAATQFGTPFREQILAVLPAGDGRVHVAGFTHGDLFAPNPAAPAADGIYVLDDWDDTFVINGLDIETSVPPGPCIPEGAPTSLRLQWLTEDGEVRPFLTWIPPTDTGGLPIIGYAVASYTDYLSVFGILDVLEPRVTPQQQIYDDGWYAVAAITEAGAGPFSEPVYMKLSQGSFTDDDNSVFETDIEWLAVAGITRGCNPPINDRFCPDEFVTRGQMAAFLHRALADTVTPGAAVEFTDDDTSIFETDIEWLGATGITRGCNPPTNDRFCPNDLVSRGQMAAFLVRALGYTGDGGGDLFTDDDNSIFEGDIDRLGTAGVTRGCNPPVNDRFCPNAHVTRGQMAAFLHRALG